MAISFVAGNTSSATTYASSYTVAKPTNTNGDLIIAIVGGKGATLSGSGWTLLMQTSARSGGSYDQTSVYYKIASSEGTGNYTVTLSTTQLAVGWIGAYRGVDGTTPIDTSNKTIASASRTNYTSSSITATAGQYGISFAAAYNYGTATVGTYTESPAPTSERADFGIHVGSDGTGENTSMVVAEYDSLSAGSFAPTITRNHTADTGDKGSLLFNAAITAVSPDAGAASATGAAYGATVAIGVNADSAAATAAAYVASSGKNAGSAAATASAKQPTVSTTPHTDASAGLATVTATAQPTRMDYAPAGRAQATATSQAPSTSIGDQADRALVTSAAYSPKLGIGVNAGVAQAVASGVTAAPGLAMEVDIARAFVLVGQVALYFGSSRTIHVGQEIRLKIIEAEDRTLMVEES